MPRRGMTPTHSLSGRDDQGIAGPVYLAHGRALREGGGPGDGPASSKVTDRDGPPQHMTACHNPSSAALLPLSPTAFAKHMGLAAEATGGGNTFPPLRTVPGSHPGLLLSNRHHWGVRGGHPPPPPLKRVGQISFWAFGQSKILFDTFGSNYF